MLKQIIIVNAFSNRRECAMTASQSDNYYTILFLNTVSSLYRRVWCCVPPSMWVAYIYIYNYDAAATQQLYITTVWRD